MPTNQQELIGTAEAARILNVDSRTVQRWATSGLLPFVGKIAGRTGAYVFDREIVDSYVGGAAA